MKVNDLKGVELDYHVLNTSTKGKIEIIAPEREDGYLLLDGLRVKVDPNYVIPIAEKLKIDINRLSDSYCCTINNNDSLFIGAYYVSIISICIYSQCI